MGDNKISSVNKRKFDGTSLSVGHGNIVDILNTVIDSANAQTEALYPPVADTTALAAIESDDRDDKMECLVESSGIFRFDSASTATPSAGDVIKPDDVTLPAAGRWIRITGVDETYAHAQNTDQYLDFGGASQIAVANIVALDGSRAYSAMPKLKVECIKGLVNTNFNLLDDCDTLDMDQIDDPLIMNGSLDATWGEYGTNSIKLESLTTDIAGDHRVYHNLAVPIDISGCDTVALIIKNGAVALDAADLQFGLYDNGGLGWQWFNVPAIGASTQESVEIAIAGTLNAVGKYGFRRHAAKIYDCNVDEILAIASAEVSALAQEPIDIGCLSIAAFATATFTPAALVEGTDYYVWVDTKHIIYITDQSANILHVFYPHK